MDSVFGLVMAPSAWPSRRVELEMNASSSLTLNAKASTEHVFKRQLHTTHVGAVGWEPQGSSSATCAEKVDQARADRCVKANTILFLTYT